MNKGLEVIEAHWLFGAPREAIEVVIHPQSVIHSLVEYVDGSVLAQLGHPDMRTPIAQALAYPERIDAGVAPLDLGAAGRARVRGARPRALPVPRARLRRARGGRHGAGRAERRQRSRRRRVPRRAASASPTSPPPAPTRWSARAARARRRSTTRCAADGEARAACADDWLARRARSRYSSGMIDCRYKVAGLPGHARRARRVPRARPLRRRAAGAASRCCASPSASAASSGRAASGRDRTEWALSAIPLGGYVKMADEREGDVAPADLARAFNRQSVWKRIAIVAAGPIANLLLAVAAVRRHLHRRHPGPARGARRARRPARRPRRPACAPATSSSRSTASRCRAGRTCAGA